MPRSCTSRPRLGRPGDDRRNAVAAQRPTEVIRIAQAHGRPVAIGGPGATSIPDGYRHADFLVLGEAEGIIDKFIAAWEAARARACSRPRNSRPMSPSPDPALRPAELRLLPAHRRAVLARMPVHLRVLRHHRALRPRTAHQDHAADAGRARWALRARLSRPCRLRRRQPHRQQEGREGLPPELAHWLEEHDYPFEFTTEASLNLADDPELLQLMNEANFIGVFVGIESPDPETLA